jgi:hypothetical protein
MPAIRAKGVLIPFVNSATLGALVFILFAHKLVLIDFIGLIQ